MHTRMISIYRQYDSYQLYFEERSFKLLDELLIKPDEGKKVNRIRINTIVLSRGRSIVSRIIINPSALLLFSFPCVALFTFLSLIIKSTQSVLLFSILATEERMFTT